ncbi:MAG: hypothetical protein GY791_05615 [Alphaproteobacteria bacterium]|nr:hypothetical protein [Alphaproteobacteria bacterium]
MSEQIHVPARSPGEFTPTTAKDGWLSGAPLEMLSPNVARIHINEFEQVLDLAEETLANARPDQSGVIEDRTGLGKLIKRNSIKSGKMAFFPERPCETRVLGLYEFILQTCRDYLKCSAIGHILRQRAAQDEDVTNIRMERCWAIDQRQNDYQILHAHIPNLLSGIVYLQIPPSMEVSTYPDGILTLIETNPFVILPSPGDMYIWPSYMLHNVYPFRGDGRRVAISFNIRRSGPGSDDCVYYRPTYVEVSRDQYYDRANPAQPD